jgi:hypothetical protein
MKDNCLGPWRCKTLWDKATQSRIYHIYYVYNDVEFYIDSYPDKELSWSSIVEKVKEREALILGG